MCSLHGRQQTTTMQHHLDRCIVIRWFIAFIILQQGDYSRPCPWRNGSWQIGTKSAHLGCSNKQDEKREEKVETERTDDRSMEFHLFCPDSSEKFAFEDIVLIEKLCASAQLSGRVCVAAVRCVLCSREDAQSELSFRSCLTRHLRQIWYRFYTTIKCGTHSEMEIDFCLTQTTATSKRTRPVDLTHSQEQQQLHHN